MTKYEMVAEQVRQDIESGVWPVNSRIDTEQTLARTYSVSRQTVRQALDILSAEGYVQRRRGSGTYVSGRESAPVSAGESRLVGMITLWTDYYVFPRILHSVERELNKSDYLTLIAATHGDVTEERSALQDMINAGARGLIVECTGLPRPNPNLDIYRMLAEKNIPVVFVNGYYAELKDSVFVFTDDRDGAYWLTTELIDQGLRNIGGIFRDDQHGMDRYYGTIKALMDRDVPCLVENFAWYYGSEPVDLIRFFSDTGRLKQYAGMDAVVCYNDLAAIQLYMAFVKNRFSDIPKIVCFDNTDLLKMSGMPIKALSLPVEEVGQIAVRKLMNMIDGKPEQAEYIAWREQVDTYRGRWL